MRDGRSLLFFSLSLGVLGGVALIATAMLSRNGFLLFVPYGAMLLIAVVYLRANAIRPFGRRFAHCLAAFLVSNLMGYAYIVLVAKSGALSDPVVTNVWPLGAMLVIGAAVSAGVAKMARPVAR